MTEVYSPVGADVDSTSTDKKFKLGSKAFAQDDQEYVYVQAGEAIVVNAAVVIDEDFTAKELTTTTAADMQKVGWAPNTAFANEEYGWALVSGTNFSGLVADDSTADSPLYTTGTDGTLSSDNSTGNPVLIAGVTCVSVASGGGASQLIATYPRISELDTAA